MSDSLSPDQVAGFRRDGYVHVPAAFAPESTGAMQDLIWAELEDLRGVKRDDPRTWSVDYAAVGMQWPKTDPVFAPMSTPRLIGAGNSASAPRFMRVKSIYRIRSDASSTLAGTL